MAAFELQNASTKASIVALLSPFGSAALLSPFGSAGQFCSDEAHRGVGSRQPHPPGGSPAPPGSPPHPAAAPPHPVGLGGGGP